MTHRKHGRGFTLVELMVTVLVISILLGVAIPTYTTQIRKSRRTDAKTALLDLAGREERYYNTNNATYSSTAADLGYSGTFPVAVSNGGTSYYTVSAPVLVAGNATQLASYSISATPTAGTSQVKDTQCAVFTVTSAGLQTSVDTGNNDTTATCWR